MHPYGKILTIMTQVDTKAFPSPPSLVNSLLAGFDTISNHIGLIFFCVVLDMFLWLGPQIRLEKLLQTFLGWTTFNPDLQTQEVADLMDANREALLMLGERVNLLTILRTFPIGVPSLMFGRSPGLNPMGESLTWQVPSFSAALALWIGLLLIGLLGGTFYFKVVAQAALNGKVEWFHTIKDWPWHFLQVVQLSLLWLAIILAISIPLACVLPFILAGGGSLGTFILVGYGVLLVWLLMPLVFAPHGIFANRSSMWPSVVQGARLTRLTLPASGLFFLAAIILSQGMDLLWSKADEMSWLTTIGIIGHAFVTTSLIAASFVYYRDANNWMQRIMQKAKLTSIKT